MYRIFNFGGINDIYKVRISIYASDGIFYWDEHLKTLDVNPKTYDDCIKDGTLKIPYGYQSPLWKVLNGETIE